jgi:multisubunit Na+/H+ antiporter MnhB subunit
VTDRIFRPVLFVLLGIFTAIMASQLFPLIEQKASLTEAVTDHISDSGVNHPLTAVLLNFRGYDTMLEMGVILVAVLAVWAIGREDGARWRLLEPRSFDPVLRVALGILTPATILVAGYMVWAGSYRPGGGFQAGTVLGAAWVIFIGAEVIPLPLSRTRGVRFALAAGFFLFLSAAVLPPLVGYCLLEYPRNFAGSIILLIETVMSIAIGASIGALVAGVASPIESGAGEGGIS